MHKCKAEIKPIRPFSLYKSKENLDLLPKITHSNSWSKIAVEIGCGSGLHPIQWAKQNPSSYLFAIERTKNKFTSFQSRMNSHCLKNISAINDDALYWLPLHIGEEQIDEYFFLYPNPYPKEKQANKRWHRNPLFHYVLKTLKNQGLITFASNDLDYINECELYGLNFWNLHLVEKKELIDKENFLYRTHFEKKYLKANQLCYNLVFQKQ